MIETLGNTDILSSHQASSVFVVYAHDPAPEHHDGVPAHAKAAKWIIEQLRSLGTRIISDRGPIPLFGSRADQYDSCHDIVANQACLIPGFEDPHQAGEIGTVDKAILCLSPRLVHYLNTEFASDFIKSIHKACMSCRDRGRDEIVEQISNLVQRSAKHPDFHHVLTEYGLLTLGKSLTKRRPRVILVTLGSELLVAPHLSSTDLQVMFSVDGPLRYLSLFKLLKRVFESEDSIIKIYADVYENNKAGEDVSESQLRGKIAGLIRKVHHDSERLSVQGFRHSNYQRDQSQAQNAQHIMAAPQASSNIPFPPDKQFVRHGDLLSRIHQECAEPYSTIALVGPAGVG